MKTLVLDKSKWICGYPNSNPRPENCLGQGSTALLNKDGYMCCLGQFARQVDPDITDSDLLNFDTPSDISHNIQKVLDTLSIKDKNGCYTCTSLSYDAIKINDNKNSTVEEKIEALIQLFAEHDIKIEVIN